MGAVASLASGCCAIIHCASCACSMASCMCSGGMGPGGVKANVAKGLYVLLIGVATVIAVLLRNYGGDIDIFGFTCATEDGNGGAADLGITDVDVGDVFCSSNGAVYRVSFICVLFFSIMFIGMVYVPTFTGDRRWGPMLGEGFHRGWWGIKLLLFFGGILGSLFMPNSAFDNDTYAWTSRVFSSFFLILQVLILIDFAYEWNDVWVERAFEDGDEGHKGWLAGIITAAAALYGGAITFVVISFIYYSDCRLAVMISVISSVSIVAITVISLFRDRIVGDDYPGAILPAAVVSAYIGYQGWSAITSDPSCGITGGETSNIAIGMAFATVSLMWTSYTVSKRTNNLLSGSSNDDVGNLGDLYRVDEKTTANDLNNAEKGEDSGATEDDSEEVTGDRAYIFHLTLLTASMYMAMLLTNWGTRGDGEDTFAGDLNMWVKIIAQWLTILLFLWTLLAPLLLGSCRDF